jgi:hypothetical protein
MGKRVTLHGVQAAAPQAVRELPVEQLVKWSKGNEIWALAVVQPDEQVQVHARQGTTHSVRIF